MNSAGGKYFLLTDFFWYFHEQNALQNNRSVAETLLLNHEPLCKTEFNLTTNTQVQSPPDLQNQETTPIEPDLQHEAEQTKT